MHPITFKLVHSYQSSVLHAVPAICKVSKKTAIRFTRVVGSPHLPSYTGTTSNRLLLPFRRAGENGDSIGMNKIIRVRPTWERIFVRFGLTIGHWTASPAPIGGAVGVTTHPVGGIRRSRRVKKRPEESDHWVLGGRSAASVRRGAGR